MIFDCPASDAEIRIMVQDFSQEGGLRFFGKHLVKVSRKFFLKHDKSFRWHLGDYEKHNFFPFEGL